ncbi:class I SAM-dependent methyltransferase [Aquabacterium sp. CECT 9606]|uniref:class I SAM-dependent methyltransferase n=1 Tax=Aquabacterium sp. CECT 9606 TaxID=2845822 RepID=UPI001E3661E3|nr:class I SAM-dependent methyltransferase [Aquabacterium sp. CECT 9606]CAH0353137.1 hypothetical protein AQB9606_03080 [Aquabacterium sp. CECT 9606]
MDVYSGWESYYVNASAAAWKDEPDAAVLDLQRRVGSINSPHVADMGCGDGRNLWPWLMRPCTVACIDMSATALQRIAKRCQDENISLPTLLKSDMSCTPLSSDQFDVVQCYDALPQIVDPAEGMAEARRILRLGGLYGFNVFTPGDAAFGEGERVGENAYLFNNTLFRFFEHGDVERLLPKGLRVIDSVKRRWTDPPHIPFRPTVHEHEAYFFVCKKVA